MKYFWKFVITTRKTAERLVSYESDAVVLKETFMQEQYAWLVKDLKPDTIAIDVGANIGDSAIYLAMQPNIKEVWAYEPYPNIYKRLEENISQSIRKDKIKIFNQAVSKPHSDYLFHINEEEIAKADSPLKQGKGREIRAIGLDKIIEQIKGDNIIIKMDCEGGEFYILDKGLDLSRVYKMQIEVHKEFGSPENLEAILKGYGFKTKLDEGFVDKVMWLYAEK
ncbi:MAG: FkbM family methyltransferase [Hydrogenobaculum sp.]